MSGVVASCWRTLRQPGPSPDGDRGWCVRRLRNGPGAIGITYVQDAGRGCRTRTSSGYAAATHAPVPTEGEQVDGRL